MNDLITQYLAELDAAQRAHDKARVDAFDAHQKADVEAFNTHSDAINASCEKLATAMGARLAAWNGEMGIDVKQLPAAPPLTVGDESPAAAL